MIALSSMIVSSTLKQKLFFQYSSMINYLFVPSIYNELSDLRLGKYFTHWGLDMVKNIGAKFYLKKSEYNINDYNSFWGAIFETLQFYR